MGNEFEQYDLATLLSIYMKETKAFSDALSKGASWQELREAHLRIRLINESINQKYQENYTHSGRRRDNKPPHSSDR